MNALKATERDIQRRLIFDKAGSSRVVMPNFTPSGWWENDFIQITRAGYWVEYEIKRSVADYRKDFCKEQCGFKKHDLLKEGNPEWSISEWHNGVVPNRFFFVVPETIVDSIDFPHYCGVIKYRLIDYGVGSVSIVFNQVTNAPYIHKTKVSEKIVVDCLSSGHGRYLGSMRDKDYSFANGGAV